MELATNYANGFVADTGDWITVLHDRITSGPLAFMLYLAPTRRAAAITIWAVACGIALILYAAYFFRAGQLWNGVRHASFFELSWKAFAMPQAYRQILAQLGQTSRTGSGAAQMALISIIDVARRTRYFGNTAPFLVSALFLALASGTPHFPGLGFQLMALPFLFVFVAGVTADLLETRCRQLVQAGVAGLLLANAAWNVWELTRAGRG